MSDDHRSLTVLIQEMLDGALDDGQRADLLSRVELDDDARKLYLDQIATHTALQAVLADCLPRRVDLPNAVDAESPSPSASAFKARWPAVAAIASIAAAITLLVSGIAYRRSQDPPIVQSVDTPHVAVVTQSVGAYDGDGVAIRSGQRVMPGQLNLDRGVIRLDFVSGARVAIEGPAKIEVVDKMRLILLRGVVTAMIPESAIGFVVDTETAHVVDLGTAFGVSVGDDGTTDVCVFEGEVTVNRRGSTSNQPALVSEGQAVRASNQSPTIDSTDYEVTPFENAWTVNSGVLQTTGSIRFVSPGPNFHPGNYKDNEHIVVFSERSDFILDDTIRVDMVDPGEYAKSRYQDKRTLPAGRRVTSYLLQFSAFSTEQFPNQKRSVRGQITFAQPIVGVITGTRLLKESEAVFGNPNVAYPVPRAVEPRPEGDQRKGFDSVILAADQRTLILDLNVAPDKIDQLRVLVEADYSPITEMRDLSP
jgi:ferric-dicitrate binding protein FerR (iron transport regulator)